MPWREASGFFNRLSATTAGSATERYRGGTILGKWAVFPDQLRGLFGGNRYPAVMKTILAPIDFSTATESVIDAAIDLAQATNGRVVLLHIVQPPILTSDYGLAMESFQEAVTLSEKHAAKRLAELKTRAESRVPEVQVEQVSGSAIAEILEAAKRNSADYLVMGSHGHTALYDLLVGSTTHGVMRRIQCPVVIVPPPQRGEHK
ncbi:hypothetical protein DB347_21830 [Opitutaceae bacterium EW11]|nr:hypothetical protein DB347_21830 [Opitutaceae bacterium EW11]